MPPRIFHPPIDLPRVVALGARDPQAAERALRSHLQAVPGDIDARLALATMLNRSGRGEAALAEVDAVLARAPAHHAALWQSAGIRVQRRLLDTADAAFQALTRQYPDDARAWMHHGHLLKTLGRREAAVAAYRRSIAAGGGGIAWWSLANLKPVRLSVADAQAMRTALAAASDDDDRLHLQFALGTALDDLDNPAGAFEHLRAGNAVRSRRAPHDAAAMSATFRRMEALLTPAFLAGRTGSGALAADPIFIVGLPRSGSTLVEQILASHPLVEGTEELHELHHVVQQIGAFPDGLATFPPTRLRDLGERYIQATRRYRLTDRPFFTDKMPSNWIYNGLIRLILPRARIIDVRRHPMACGFANFAQHYNRGNDFAYDLDGIGRFYVDYVRHMAHLDRVAPGFVHRVTYEALVDDLEREVRRLLDYLGLPFDDACLRFHETDRAVHTPSAGQVRRPIDRAGIDRWRGYERWLGPLEQALGPVLDAYPDPPPGW